MSDLAVKRAVAEGANAVFGPHMLREVQIEPDVDTEGREILRVLLVLPDGAIKKLGGDKLLQANVAIKRAVSILGEERRPILSYATPEELEDDGEAES